MPFDIRRARFDSYAVRVRVGTDHFDFDEAGGRASGDVAPGLACDGQRVDGIGNDGQTVPQVVFRQAVSDPVAGVIHRSGNAPCGDHRLLD